MNIVKDSVINLANKQSYLVVDIQKVEGTEYVLLVGGSPKLGMYIGVEREVEGKVQLKIVTDKKIVDKVGDAFDKALNNK